MNNILQLKGRFDQRPNPTKPGSPKLPKGKRVTSNHMRSLATQCTQILSYWKENTEIQGALVSVHYKHIVAKSNRLKILLSENSKSPLESIRGAKFLSEVNEGEDRETMKHVFTHFVSLAALEKTISLLNETARMIDAHYGGSISSTNTDKIVDEHIYDYEDEMKKAPFLKAVVDCYYVERFDIDRVTEDISEESIITIYQTGVETKRLLARFGINVVEDRIIDGTTLRLRPDEIRILCERASYLIAMSVTDFSQLTKDDVLCEYGDLTDNFPDFPKPTTEPVVGVIDTLFNDKVYFNEWVEFHNMVSPDIPVVEEDYYHGTSVSYIIVDGPKGNPELDDGCGRFRVRHFGVATHSGFSSFAILKLIREIVASNRDIKVWNLSLGSKMEIKPNFISPEAAELDKIQSEFDVLFVIAGTNKPAEDMGQIRRIGAPADSLNAIVVNSVDFSGKSASYTRVGPVLSFFHKPDVSYYGGDGKVSNEKMVVCRDSLGAAYVSGTSFAAPWVTRKLAFLIDVLKLNREVAKALIIDSAAGWNRQDDVSHSIGYGLVPKRIEDIVKTPNDEIRFLMTGSSEAFETYTYNIPVPIVNNLHPFYARATLAYFPQCNRNQGVDYTSTEMDIHFGRIEVKGGKAGIKSIDDNKQSEEGLITLYEEDARKMYRKWDNVKHISEEIKGRAIPRKAYASGLWGLSVKTKERSTKRKDGLQFGVVVTLKEMNGVNRIDDFIKLCMARGWIVNRLDIDNQIDVYVKAEEEIEFD